MRKTIAIVGALAILAGLTACASGPDAASCVRPGDASAAVKATGAKDKALKVTIPTPLYVKTTQKSELKAGSGDEITAGQPVKVFVTIVDTKTGQPVQSGETLQTAGATFGAIDPQSPPSTIPAISKGLVCATVGSRIAIASSPKDAGATGKDSYVFVVDVEKAYLAKANGTQQDEPASLPPIIVAPDGTPGFQPVKTAAPKTAVSSVLKSGSGAVVKKDSKIIAKLAQYAWSDGTVGSNASWGKPDALAYDVTQLPKDMSKNLVGRRVGSQVLVVVPGKEVGETEQQVFVFDILGIE